MAVLVLLGAGASFGSIGAIPYPPPLGNNLFSELLKIKGVAATIPDRIKKIFKENFEEGMAEYTKLKDGNVMSFQRELAEYLASFQPTRDSVYLDLIKELGCKRVIYSSLNYDLLFEISAANLNLFTNHSSEYQQGGVRLLKIHGSSNFWPNIPTRMITNCTSCGKENATFLDAQIKPLNQRDTLLKCRMEDSIAPAMSIFAVGKHVNISPAYVDNQYEMWKQQVIKSSKIFVVGVRVHEVDEHIWSLLGSAKGSVTYFGFDSDKPEFELWKSNWSKRNAYFYKGDFKKSIKIIRDKIRI